MIKINPLPSKIHSTQAFINVLNNSKGSLKQTVTQTQLKNYFLCQKPINLLFAIDQFLFEFVKKIPQRKKFSTFKLKLKNRKKLKVFYGYLSTKQLSKIVEQSKNYPGYFSKNLLSNLEIRIDTILYRSNFTKTITQARQLIIHKKIKVNNLIIETPSYILKPGDIISVSSEILPQVEVLLKNSLISVFEKFQTPHSDKLLKNLFFSEDNTFCKKEVQTKKQIFLFTKLLLNKVSLRAIVNSEKLFLFLNYITQTKYQKVLLNNKFNPFFDTYYSNTLFKTEKNNSDTLQIKFNEKVYYKQYLFNILKKLNISNIPPYLLYLKFSKFLSKKPVKKHILNKFQYYGMKPLNLEISYKLMKIIYLYPPQRIYYPFFIELDNFKK